MTDHPFDSADVVPLTDVRTLRHGVGERLATAVAFTSIRPIVGFGGTALLISYAGLSAWTALVALLAILLLVAAVVAAVVGSLGFSIVLIAGHARRGVADALVITVPVDGGVALRALLGRTRMGIGVRCPRFRDPQ